MRTIACSALCVWLLVAAGCGSSPPKPIPAKADLVVAPEANPDTGGRPSPIVVRLYQLKSEGEFNGADYFALVDKERETLGASVLSREEYELRPGEIRTIELKIPPEAKYLAAIAGFRDLRNSKWKALSPAPEKGLKDLVRTKKLTISVTRSEVKITVGN